MAKPNEITLALNHLMKASIQGATEERDRIIQIIKQPSRMTPGTLNSDAREELEEMYRLVGFEKVIETLLCAAIIEAKKQIIKDIESGMQYEELAQKHGWDDKSKGWFYYED